MAIATATAIAIAAAAASTTGTIYAANRGANAAEEGARTQSDAANHAADVQGKGNADALAFQRQQSENAWRDSERIARANYEQSRGRHNAARTLGQTIGFDLPDMPDYVAGEDPRFDQAGGPTSTASSPSRSTPSGYGAQDAQLGEWLRGGMDPAQAIAKFNQQFGRTHGNEATFSHDNTIAVPTGYYATGSNGWQFAAGDHSGGGGGGNQSQGPSLFNAAPVQVQAPRDLQNPFQPGTLGFALRRRS